MLRDKRKKWPWGNHYETKRCNCRETSFGDTTSVDHFKAGISSYQCYDLSGNVWEWTNSWYNEENAHKVLRGGSWFSFEDFTTTTYRNFDFPTIRKGVYGFRCCKSFSADNKP